MILNVSMHLEMKFVISILMDVVIYQETLKILHQIVLQVNVLLMKILLHLYLLEIMHLEL